MLKENFEGFLNPTKNDKTFKQKVNFYKKLPKRVFKNLGVSALAGATILGSTLGVSNYIEKQNKNKALFQKLGVGEKLDKDILKKIRDGKELNEDENEATLNYFRERFMEFGANRTSTGFKKIYVGTGLSFKDDIKDLLKFYDVNYSKSIGSKNPSELPKLNNNVKILNIKAKYINNFSKIGDCLACLDSLLILTNAMVKDFNSGPEEISEPLKQDSLLAFYKNNRKSIQKKIFVELKNNEFYMNWDQDKIRKNISLKREGISGLRLALEKEIKFILDKSNNYCLSPKSESKINDISFRFDKFVNLRNINRVQSEDDCSKIFDLIQKLREELYNIKEVNENGNFLERESLFDEKQAELSEKVQVILQKNDTLLKNSYRIMDKFRGLNSEFSQQETIRFSEKRIEVIEELLTKIHSLCFENKLEEKLNLKINEAEEQYNEKILDIQDDIQSYLFQLRKSLEDGDVFLPRIEDNEKIVTNGYFVFKNYQQYMKKRGKFLLLERLNNWIDKDIKEVCIPESLHSTLEHENCPVYISDNFRFNQKVKKITIKSSTENLNQQIFKNCQNLKKINFINKGLDFFKPNFVFDIPDFFGILQSSNIYEAEIKKRISNCFRNSKASEIDMIFINKGHNNDNYLNLIKKIRKAISKDKSFTHFFYKEGKGQKIVKLVIKKK